MARQGLQPPQGLDQPVARAEVILNGVMVFLPGDRSDPAQGNAVDPLAATAMINHEDAVVVDVRSMAEFKDGHIVNAVNIPLNSLGNSIKQLEKYRNRPIVAVCRSGSRSGAACGLLRKNGFENVKNLRGGMLAWESASLPVKRR